MKHVFLIFNDLGIGGTQTKFIDLANHLCQEPSLTIHLVLRESGVPSRMHLLSPKCQVHLSPRVPFGRLPLVIFIWWLLLKYRPISILSSLWHESFISIVAIFLSGSSTRLIISQDNDLIHDISPLFHSLASQVYNRANVVIALTKHAKQEMIQTFHIKPSKIKVISNGLGQTRLLTQPKKYDLIFVGRFEAQKNLTQLIKIVTLLKRRRKKINLLLVGTGSQAALLKRLVRRYQLHSNVIFHAPSEDVRVLLAQARVLVLVSKFEGHPYAVLEAMCQQVVPVVLNNSGVTEYIDHGFNGLIATDSGHCLMLISQLLQNNALRIKIGIQARQTVLSRFNSRYLVKYQQLLT